MFLYKKKIIILFSVEMQLEILIQFFIDKHTNVHKHKKKKYTYIPNTCTSAKSLKEFRSQF